MKRVMLGLALSLTAPLAGLPAQEAVHPGWPNVNRTIEVGPGETVDLLSRMLVDRGPGLRPVRRLDYQIRTTIPQGDAAAREAQAARVAQALGDEARTAGARLLSVAICDSDACATRHEPPRVWYIFERGPGGVWQRVRD